MNRRHLLALAGLAAVVLIAAGWSGGASANEATIGIHFSHYTPSDLTAKVGEPITITLRNDDPIAHEWIVGTPQLHEIHRTAPPEFHNQFPTEVTIPALTTRVTTVQFDAPGDYQYICHLPGHEAYGMVGTLHVVAD
ncbi:MAG: cupredoxin domain-containing protein [Chloroflexota bacterium]